MTDDLVKRLREYRIGCGVHCSDYSNREPLEECFEAANRIEQLEAALITIILMTPDPEFGTLPIESAIKVARAALGEK
jgi:hypothetical protein